MIRTSYNKALGGVLPDDIWKPAIESTGGKFYAAATRRRSSNAIKDIDRRSAGRVDMKRYSTPAAEVCRLRAHRRRLLDAGADAAVDGAVFPQVSVRARASLERPRQLDRALSFVASGFSRTLG